MVVTYVLLHGVQDECLELVQTVVDSRSPSLLHDWLVALSQEEQKNSLLDEVNTKTGTSATEISCYLSLYQSIV
jgi:hypothetical protein